MLTLLPTRMPSRGSHPKVLQRSFERRRKGWLCGLVPRWRRSECRHFVIGHNANHVQSIGSSIGAVPIDRISPEDAFWPEVAGRLWEMNDEIARVEILRKRRVDQKVSKWRCGIPSVGYLWQDSKKLDQQLIDDCSALW